MPPMTLSLALGMLGVLVSPVAAAQPAINIPPMADVPAQAARADETAGQLRLYNRHTALVLDRSTGRLVGIWSSTGVQLVDNTLLLGMPWVPLWSAQLWPTGAEKAVGVDARAGAPTCELDAAAADRAAIVLHWKDLTAGEMKLSASMRIELSADAQQFTWTMDAALTAGAGSVWSVTYPQLAVLASDPQPDANRMLIPYRRGTVGPFGRAQVRYDTQQPYPGPAAKFQFMATFGQTNRQGVYFAAQDGQACDKVFIQKNYPDRNAVLLALEHHPDGRATPGAPWHAPYPTIAGSYAGDWYDACRIYRAWWMQQVWASQGLLVSRSDIPAWIMQASAVTRPSTTQAARTIEKNVRGSQALLAALDHRPFFGVWYGVFENLTGQGGLDKEGHGVVRPLKTGLTAAVASLKAQGIHHLAYVQSIIYDPEAGDAADVALADKYVGRDRAGNPMLYGPPKYAMCRATDWWQQRIADLCVQAVRGGFDGVYLDSFGKGSNECLDPTHGHSLGGGNLGIAGQRQMAQRALAAMRQLNPDAVLSGEAPTEAFRDLLHVNLYAKNTWAGYVPAFRAIWGDYSLGFGRNIRPAKDGPGNMIPEMAALFVEGAVVGRIFVDGGSASVLEPGSEPALAYLKLITDYTLAGLDHLRFGDYLHPLDLGDLPTVAFSENVENGKVESPVVLHSVTRSHRDGSVAVVLTNISDSPVQLEVPIDPAWRSAGAAGEATLYQMGRAGERTRLASGRQAWRQPVTIAPRDVVFLLLP